jgi:predicted esterase
VDGDTAEFSLYIPTSVDKIVAAVYISLHGQGTITYSVLQEFAAAENLALVGFYGDGVQRGVDDVAILDEHIATLAIMSGHAELPDAPIMTFGHSNGSGFAASWPRDRPEQVISWVSFHPGFSAYLQYDNTDDVPSMVMCGESDSYFINSRQDEIVYDLRNTEDAVMNVMVEGDVSHGWGNKEESWTFITEFWKATMRIRLEDDGTLTDIDTTSGWLGSQYDVDEGQRQLLDIGAYADYDDDPSNANWLPDAEFAEMWQSYGNAPVGEWLDD